jgi:hypothetical protein
MLCQTEERKLLQWNSMTPEIRAGELDPHFTTTSKVCIIAHAWPQDSPDIAAIESRAQTLFFAPSPQEMHAYAGTWFTDREVYDYIGEHLDHLDTPDLRLYYKAAERRRMGDDWKAYVVSRCYRGDDAVALRLLREPHWRSDNARAKEFHRLTGRCTRDLYRIRDRLMHVKKSNMRVA